MKLATKVAFQSFLSFCKSTCTCTYQTLGEMQYVKEFLTQEHELFLSSDSNGTFICTVLYPASIHIEYMKTLLINFILYLT